MREISTEKVKIGEHILIDGEKYVAEEAIGKMCSLCAFHNSYKCENIPCNGVIFKRVDKVKEEPIYRPYKDTAEMIADWTERFMVDEIADFCMPIIWVKKKDSNICSLITGIMPEYVYVVIGGNCHSMKDLFEYYTYLDGSPCGKVEE